MPGPLSLELAPASELLSRTTLTTDTEGRSSDGCPSVDQIARPKLVHYEHVPDQTHPLPCMSRALPQRHAPTLPDG
jgi:hypothetical protein